MIIIQRLNALCNISQECAEPNAQVRRFRRSSPRGCFGSVPLGVQLKPKFRQLPFQLFQDRSVGFLEI